MKIITIFFAIIVAAFVWLLAMEAIGNTYQFFHSAHYDRVYLGDNADGSESVIMLKSDK